MNIHQQQALAALERVGLFLTQHPLESPPPGFTDKATVLARILVRALDLAGNQDAAHNRTRGFSREQQRLRNRLRRLFMMPLKQVARSLLAGSPALQEHYKVPGENVSNVKLLAVARGMVENAQLHEASFIAEGQRPDFIARFNQAMDAVQQTTEGGVTSRGAGSGATAGLESTLKAGRNAVNAIDAVLRVEYSDDPQLMAAWRDARRIRRNPGTRRRKQSTGPSQDETSQEAVTA